MDPNSPLMKRSLERRKREELNSAFDRLREAVLYFGQHRSALGTQVLVIRSALQILQTNMPMLQQIIVPEVTEGSKKSERKSVENAEATQRPLATRGLDPLSTVRRSPCRSHSER